MIRTGNKQYQVAEGDILEIDRLGEGKDKKEIEFNDVLLFVNENTVKVGKPTLDIKVKASVLENTLGEKIKVFKFKAKTQYHKTIGYRSKLTKVKVEKILNKGDK